MTSRDVAEARLIGYRSARCRAGTIAKPPPTPKNPVRKPVSVARAMTRQMVASVQDPLAGRDDCGALLVGYFGQRESVPHDLVGEVEIRLKSSAYGLCHVINIEELMMAKRKPSGSSAVYSWSPAMMSSLRWATV